MTVYEETHLEEDDLESAVLAAVANGQPFLFLVDTGEGEGLGIKATTGGGITDVGMVRNMLELTLKALP